MSVGGNIPLIQVQIRECLTMGERVPCAGLIQTSLLHGSRYLLFQLKVPYAKKERTSEKVTVATRPSVQDSCRRYHRQKVFCPHFIFGK